MKFASFSATQRKALTSTDGSFAKAVSSGNYVVYADRKALINIDGAATQDSFPIPEYEHVQISLSKDGVLHFVAMTGETDGNIWISKVTP
ncbi:hypothetical protein GC176_20530 [bacterium]|nr:hypothetical protein [bacterium]